MQGGMGKGMAKGKVKGKGKGKGMCGETGEERDRYYCYVFLFVCQSSHFYYCPQMKFGSR